MKSAFPRDSAQFQIAPEVPPLPSEVVFDKITMSTFEGTLLNIALRDFGINAVSIVGVAMEVGDSDGARGKQRVLSDCLPEVTQCLLETVRIPLVPEVSTF